VSCFACPRDISWLCIGDTKSTPLGRPLIYLSGSSANALISELRPTTLSQPALHYVNQLLDEILCNLITSSSSINPYHLRIEGIPSVFSSDKSQAAGFSESTGVKALGRAAVGEAEMELRSWYESHPTSRAGNGGFQPDGKGRGMTDSRERGNASFPANEAMDLLRLKCSTFCVSRALAN
jgi:hypothetical protein